MQKVVGSSPIIRFHRTLAAAGVFVFYFYIHSLLTPCVPFFALSRARGRLVGGRTAPKP